jgi:hypothetical protein
MTTYVLTAEVAEKFLNDSGSMDLDIYTALDSQAAAVLAASTVDLCLNGLDEIKEEAAKALIPHVGAISLEGLARLSLGASQALAEHVGPLRGVDLLRFVGDCPTFSALRRHPSLVAKVLEDDSLARMLKTKDIDHEDAYEFEFADAASNDLADEEYYGNPMDEGLRFLDKAEGKPVWSIPLSSVKDSWVCDNAERYTLYFIGDRKDVLRRISELPNRVLTKTIAKKWAKESGSVNFSFYGELSDDAASILASTSEDRLELDGLTTLSESAAKSLAELKGDLLLYGLTTLSEGAAAALAQHKGGPVGSWLELFGVTELTDGAVKALGSHNGFLSLGLTALSDEAANSLSHHVGELSLPYLTSLSDAAAVALAKHEGELWLSGVTTLSDAAAAALAKHRDALELQGVSTISDAAAAALATHRGKLDLSGLDTLSDAAAVALATHRGNLNLSGLDTLSDAAAVALAKHEGELWLSGVTTLSDAAAAALSKYEDELDLCRITKLSDVAARLLAANPKVRLPDEIRDSL